jgi:AAA15 family ATPase/GTPase
MYLTSSSINQLTTLLLYLKHWVSDTNNFLFVDEPEENLHPENQEKLIHTLLKFAATNNNKVLITTHSSLVTSVINNFLNIGYLKSKQDFNLNSFLTKHHVDFDVKNILEKKDFGIYFFSGSDVIEYSAKEYGVYFEDFDKIEKNIKNFSEFITDEIYRYSEQ